MAAAQDDFPCTQTEREASAARYTQREPRRGQVLGRLTYGP